jgi:hypothetical protein
LRKKYKKTKTKNRGGWKLPYYCPEFEKILEKTKKIALGLKRFSIPQI